MFFGEDAVVTGLQVLNVSFQQAEKRIITGRPFYGLTFRFAGKISLETGQTSLISEPDTITFVPMNQDYVTEILEDGQMIAVHFTMENVSQQLCPQVIADREDLGRQFLHLWEAYRKIGRCDFRCMSLFYDILAELFVSPAVAHVTGPIEKMRDYMIRNLKDSDLNMPAIAERYGFSDSYFRRAFKKMFGVPPSVYLQQIRIDHAKMLLRSGYYAVGQVADLCGFNSLSYFSATFHRFVGCSPLAYRDNK